MTTIKFEINLTMANWLLMISLCICALTKSTVANDLGTSCQHDMDCTDFIKGSTCSNDGYCECAPYYVQLNRTTCLPSQLLGGDCHLAEQCSMKVANSSCLGGACRCVEGFLQFRKHTCLGPAHPGAVCYSNAHCQMFDRKTHCDFLIPNLFGRCQCTAPTKQFGGMCKNPDDESVDQWGTLKPEGIVTTIQSTASYPLEITASTTVHPLKIEESTESETTVYYSSSSPSHPILIDSSTSKIDDIKTPLTTVNAAEDTSEVATDPIPLQENQLDVKTEPEVVTLKATTSEELDGVNQSTELPIQITTLENHKIDFEDDVLDLDGQSDHYGHETPEDYPYKIDEDYNDIREQEQNSNSSEDSNPNKGQYQPTDSQSIENEQIDNIPSTNTPLDAVSLSTEKDVNVEELIPTTIQPLAHTSAKITEAPEIVTDGYAEEHSEEELITTTAASTENIVTHIDTSNELTEKNQEEEATESPVVKFEEDEAVNEAESNEKETDIKNVITFEETAASPPKVILETEENQMDTMDKKKDEDKIEAAEHTSVEINSDTALNNDKDNDSDINGMPIEANEDTSNALDVVEQDNPLEEAVNEHTNIESANSNEDFEDSYTEQSTEFSVDDVETTNVGHIMPQYPENEEDEASYIGYNEMNEKPISSESDLEVEDNNQNENQKEEETEITEEETEIAEEETEIAEEESQHSSGHDQSDDDNIQNSVLNVSEDTNVEEYNTNKTELNKEEAAEVSMEEELVPENTSNEQNLNEKIDIANALPGPKKDIDQPQVEGHQTFESFEDVHSRPSSNDESHSGSSISPIENQEENESNENQIFSQQTVDSSVPTKITQSEEENSSSESVSELNKNEEKEDSVENQATENLNTTPVSQSMSSENVSPEQSEEQISEQPISEKTDSLEDKKESELIEDNLEDSEGSLSDPLPAINVETSSSSNQISSNNLNTDFKLPGDQAGQVGLITGVKVEDVDGNEPYDTVEFSEDHTSNESHESEIDSITNVNSQQQVIADVNESSEPDFEKIQGNHKSDIAEESTNGEQSPDPIKNEKDSEEPTVSNDKQLETQSMPEITEQTLTNTEIEEDINANKSQESDFLSAEEAIVQADIKDDFTTVTTKPIFDLIHAVTADSVNEEEHSYDSVEKEPDHEESKDEFLSNHESDVNTLGSDEISKKPESETSEELTTVIPIEESSFEQSSEDKIPEASEHIPSVHLLEESVSTEKPSASMNIIDENDSVTSAYDRLEQSVNETPENYEDDEKFSQADSIVDILQTLIAEEATTDAPEKADSVDDLKISPSLTPKEELENEPELDEESQTPTLLDPVEELDDNEPLSDTNESVNPTDIPEDQKLVTFYPDMDTLESNENYQDREKNKVNYNLPVKVSSDKTKPSESSESAEKSTLSPNELPFDIPEDTKHPAPESDNLIVENVPQKFPVYYHPVTTQVPDIDELTTETMLGLASRPTIMETSAPITTTLQPFIEEITTTTQSPKINNERLSAIENRKRVDLGDGPVSLGLKCMSHKQCQLADPNTVCNSKRRCDCAHEGIQKMCSAERTGCSPGTFQCRSSGVCISWFFVCDGRPDCHDASDEECIFNARTNQTCPTESFHCYHSGRCISRAALCDGRKQCPHGEDEVGCNALKTGKCPPNTFRCKSGECLPEYEYCNAIISCRDGSDEPPHLCGSRSVPNIFLRLLTGTADNGFNNINRYCPHRCNNGRCRSTAIVCSGRDGCGDGTDEETCSVCRCPAAVFGQAKFMSNQPPMPLW